MKHASIVLLLLLKTRSQRPSHGNANWTLSPTDLTKRQEEEGGGKCQFLISPRSLQNDSPS